MLSFSSARARLKLGATKAKTARQLRDATMFDLDPLYRLLPVPLQNMAVSAYGGWVSRRRYGRGYEEILSAVLERQRWSQEEVRELQRQRLHELVRHCYEKVPWYRDILRSRGLTPHDFREPSDLRKLPVLRKDQVRKSGREFFSEDVGKRRHIHSHTSGTTGAGMQFSIDLAAHQEQWAVWWRYRISHGINLGTWCAYFGGRTFVPVSQQKPPFWRINLPARQVLYSMYHISRETVSSYVNNLRKRSLPWIHGYPSTLALLARHVVDAGVPLKFAWATVGAENLFPWQKRLIETAFGCRCYQHYGSAEAVANFSECSAGNLHADEDFCVVELIPTGVPGQFSIVGTCLANYVMPFIRYDTGDVCSAPLDECPCGIAGLVVSRIDGRAEDYVLLSNGRTLGRLDHIFKDAVNVREAQIVQTTPGKVTLRVVPADTWTSRDGEALVNEFKKRTGPYLGVDIEYRKELERAASGKLRFVVSECEGGKLDALRVELCERRDVN